MTRARTRRGLVPAVLLAFALIAAGCGGDDDDDLGSLQAGETDTGGETDEGTAAGDSPVGALEFGTEYTITVDPEAAPNTLSIPPGSVTTVTMEGSPANTSQAGLTSSDGALSLFVEPGGTAELESPVITAREEGLDLTISAQGVAADRFTFTIENEPQPDDPDGGDAPEIITDAVAIDGAAKGLLGGPDQTDYYTFDASGGDMVTLSAAMGATENGSITAALEFNGAEKARTSVQPGGEDETQLILTDQEGGQWYVKVWGQGAYTVTVETASQNDGGAEGDAPDSAAGAVPVTSGTFPGLLGNEDRSDFYAIELDPGAVVEVEIANDAASSSQLSVRLYINGVEQARASAAPGGTESFLSTLPNDVSGPANLEVWGSGGSYEITLSLGQQKDGGTDGDAGPDAGTATDVENNSSFEGLLSRDDRSDFYALTAPAGTLPFSIEVAPEAEGSISARVYVGGVEVKRVSAGPGGTEAAEAEIEAAGPINVEVWGQGGAYTVTLGTPPADEADTE